MPVIIFREPTKSENRAILSKEAEKHQPYHWGQILKELREEQDLSQRELATIAKVNRNALRKLEQDPRNASFDLIEKIAFILGFEFDLHAKQKSVYTSEMIST